MAKKGRSLQITESMVSSKEFRRLNNPNKKKVNHAQLRADYDRGLGIFRIIFLMLMLCALISFFKGENNVPTFSSFLEFLRDCPTFRLDLLSFDLLSTQSTGCESDFFISFADFFIQIWNGLTFLGMGIFNSLVIIVWFLRWLF